MAYFNDVEDSDGNILTAGSLDFSLTDMSFDKSIGLTEKITIGSVLVNSGTLPFQYTGEIEKISGSNDFCNALELEVELNGIEKHDDSLMLFDVGASTMLGTWDFEFQLPYSASNISHGEECEIDFVFKAWQSEIALYEDSGFTDEERIRVTLTSRMIVLNEFLPRPDGIAYGFDFGDDSSDMPQGEWVEIYNNSTVSKDLSGWYIWDASGSENNKIAITATNTYPASTTIGGEGWLVVYMNKAVLNNTGDTVKLYNSSNVLVDSYAYATPPDFCDIEPTPGDENSTTGTGSCVDVPSNKSYARIPDGIGVWVDPVPTPGGINVLEDGNKEIIENNWVELTPEELLIELSPEEGGPIPSADDLKSSSTTTEIIEEEPVSESDPVESFEEIVEVILETIEDILDVPEVIIEEQPIEEIETSIEEEVVIVEPEVVEETTSVSEEPVIEITIIEDPIDIADPVEVPVESVEEPVDDGDTSPADEEIPTNKETTSA